MQTDNIDRLQNWESSRVKDISPEGQCVQIQFGRPLKVVYVRIVTQEVVFVVGRCIHFI